MAATSRVSAVAIASRKDSWASRHTFSPSCSAQCGCGTSTAYSRLALARRVPVSSKMAALQPVVPISNPTNCTRTSPRKLTSSRGLGSTKTAAQHRTRSTAGPSLAGNDLCDRQSRVPSRALHPPEWPGSAGSTCRNPQSCASRCRWHIAVVSGSSARLNARS